MPVKGEVKWTPGPWLREGTTIYALYVPEDPTERRYKKGEPIEVNRFYANVSSCTREASEGEIEAVSQLMQAAPKLYKELFRALAVINSPESFDLEQVKNDIAAALRSARGEE